MSINILLISVVAVVQLVEQQIVILFVVGSSPISHPILKKPCVINRQGFFFAYNFI
jgi:hypothetical protein